MVGKLGLKDEHNTQQKRRGARINKLGKGVLKMSRG
jgi:hypothetical protein